MVLHSFPPASCGIPRRDGGFYDAMEATESKDRKEKRNVLTGGMILITLGILVFLHKLDVWAFSSSWPLLLIVIAAGTLIQRVKDLGGWIIGCVGFIFFLSENIGVEIWKVVNILLPLLLVLAGIHTLRRNVRKKDDDSGNGPS